MRSVLSEAEDAGLFKTILYRKTVENKVMVLGGETGLGKDHKEFYACLRRLRIFPA